MSIDEVTEKLGGRKIVVWLILLLANFALIWAGKINADNWVEMETWVTMALLGANALTHFAQNFRK